MQYRITLSLVSSLFFTALSFNTQAQDINDPDIRNYFLTDSVSYEVRDYSTKATKKSAAACAISTYHVYITGDRKLVMNLREWYALNDRWTTYKKTVSLDRLDIYNSEIKEVTARDINLVPQKYYRLQYRTKNNYADVEMHYDNYTLGPDDEMTDSIGFAFATREQAEKAHKFIKSLIEP